MNNLLAAIGISSDEAERRVISGPPGGRRARAIELAYHYPAEVEAHGGGPVLHRALAVPLREDGGRLGKLTVYTSRPDHAYDAEEVRRLEDLAERAAPAIENARRFRAARQLADLDALTRLHNRRYFHETLARECARAHRLSRQLSLVVFDLDDFKDVNDQIGHLAGDDVLAEAAERVREVVRSADIPCRVGGDEFAVILPEWGRQQAERDARLRRRGDRPRRGTKVPYATGGQTPGRVPSGRGGLRRESGSDPGSRLGRPRRIIVSSPVRHRNDAR